MIPTRGRLGIVSRKAVVEPVFGQIKEARGFRRFLLRGLGKVQAEWQMICAPHNRRKLFRLGWNPQRTTRVLREVYPERREWA